MKRLFTTLSSVFASRAFFVATLIFFVLQALWIAVTALYPMAFDEDFHFGIIQIYATHWSPFLTEHPANADAFGAIVRDPSYLYHYLMSFPYRWLQELVADETTRIIVLRIINVVLFAYALVVFRRVLQRITHSNAFTNIAIAILTFVPIVPQLAAHINYDNLLMVLVAWCFLLVTDVNRQFNAGRVDIRTLVMLLVLCLLASLVKYPFLPIFIGIILFVAYDAWRNFGTWPKLQNGLSSNYKILATRTKVGLLLLFLVTGGLFFQRFGVNAITYHTPIPSCEKVLPIENCSSYGPWIRDYTLGNTKGDVDPNPFAYSFSWVKGLWWRLFFAVNGPLQSYANYPPLPFPATAAVVLAVTMAVLLVVYAKRIFRGQPLIIFSGIVVGVYCTSLWIENYLMYLETGQPVAINGRYLIPVLLLMGVLGWRGFHVALARRPQLKVAVATVVLACFIYGGGVFTYILRSDASWYFPSHTAVRMNDTARDVIAPLIIEGSKQTDGKQP